MCQSAKQSRDDFKDVHGLEDLSLNNFRKEIFRNVLFLQHKYRGGKEGTPHLFSSGIVYITVFKHFILF